MRRKKKFTSALSFVLSLLMAASCVQPVMAAQAVPGVESVSGEAAAQAEGNEDTNVSVSAAPAKEETSEAPAESTENTPTEETAPAETTESTQEESDFDSGSTADLTETKELESESSDAVEPAALSSDSEISPLADTDAYAILYKNGELVFQRGSTPDASKGTVLGTYTGFETKKYTGYNNYAPWHENKASIKTVSFKDAVKPISTAYWFYECKNLTDVDFTNLDTSAVTSMRYMFQECGSLKSLDLSPFNTSAVTSMDYMFYQCSSLTSLDLSSFNTSAVTDMGWMFARCSSLTSLDLSSFNTSAVTSMGSMFYDCRSLTNLNLSSFDTSAVTDMYAMFEGCSALTNLDVSSFDTSAITDMRWMFSSCSSLTSLDVNSFDTSVVTNMGSMFYDCRSLTSLNLSSFDTSAVTSMRNMFNRCSALTNLDVSSFDTSTVTDMYAMFEGCSALTNLDVSSFDTSAVTNMGWMFALCSSLTSLDLSSFNTSAVTSMGYMFNNCRSLTSLDLSSFNTSAITNMGSMFGNCSAIETLTLGTKFAFKGDTNLVDATWHGINTDKKYTTSVLTSTYDGPTMADTYAKYIDIKFDALDGKSSESKKSGYIGMAFDSLPTAEKRGYDFVGWFTEKQGGTQLLVNQPITQSTYYAHYSQNAYAILYESGEMVFQRGSTPDASKGNVLKTYTGFETKEYDYYSEAPWYENRTSVKSVSFKDVIKPVSTAFWFYDCENLAGVDFTNLDTSAVTDMGHMFEYCCSLTSLDLSSFNTSAVTDMGYMFSDCSKLTSLDVSSFDTKSVTNMAYMFFYCSALTSLDLSSFNTSAVTNMDSMFQYCRSLTSLDVSSFDTSEVTNMAYMFYSCNSLTSLDVSSFDTSAVTDMGHMFYNCSAIETLTLGTKFAFKGDTNLVDATWHGINTGKKYTTSVLTSTYDGPTMADTYIKCFDIKFDAMGGKSSESKKTGYIGMAFDSLPTAEKRGYDFVGWFTEKQGGTQLLVNQPITQSTYYAQYTEHKYTITVTNDVAGTMGDKTKDFTFQLKMTGNTPAELHYTKGTETGTLKVTDGVAEFTLSHGENIVLSEIPIDTMYEITEVDGASSGYTVESTNSSGTLTEDTNVSFTNTRNGTVPTSAHTNILISIGVFAIALAGLFWHLRKKKQ